MGIENPSDEEILVASPVFQAKILSLRKQISDKENDLMNLDKDIVAKQYTNQQLDLQKAELDTFISERTALKEKLQADLKDLQAQVDENKKAILEHNQYVATTKADLTSRIDKVSQVEKENETLRQGHQLKLSEVTKKEQELVEKEKMFNDKISKSKEIWA